MHPNNRFNSTFSRCIVLTGLLLLGGVLIGSTGAIAISPEERDISTLDGGVIYDGQEVRIDVSSADYNVTTGDNLYLIKYTDRPDFDVQKVFTVDGDMTIGTIDSTGLSVEETYGIANSTAEGQAVVDGEFTKLDTDLEVSWVDNTVDAETSSAVVDIQSQRADSYPLTISSNTLSRQQLADLFGSGATITEDPSDIPFEELGYDPDQTTAEEVSDDGYLTVTNWQDSDGDIVADFATLSAAGRMPSPGDYTFEFLVADTGESDTATIEVTQAKQEASFTQNVYDSTAGDLATIEFNVGDTGEVFLQIGDKAGFRDVLYVDVADTDETVTIQMNTRVMGTDYQNLTGSGDIYQTDNVDRLVSAYHDGPTSQTTGIDPFKQGNQTINGKPIFYDTNEQQTTYIGYLRDNGGFISASEGKEDMLDNPLDPVNYRMQIAGVENVVPGESVFEAGDEEPTNLLGSATLTLYNPTVSDISVYQLGEGEATSNTDIGELTSDGQSPPGVVSNGDRLLVEIEASGMFGAIAAGGPDRATDLDRITGRFDTELLHEISENAGNSFVLDIKSVPEVGNKRPSKVDLATGATETVAIADYGEKTIYIIINTDGDGVLTEGLPAGQTDFIAEYGYTGRGYNEQFRFKGGTPLGGAFEPTDGRVQYPYIQPGEKMVVNQTFTLGPSEIALDNRYSQEVHILPESGVEIEGETNLPPDASGTIEVRNRKDKSYIRDAGFDVNGDEFSSDELDLSDYPVNTTSTIIIKTDAANIPDKSAKIVAEIGQQETFDTGGQNDTEQQDGNITVEVPPQNDQTQNQTQQSDDDTGDDTQTNDQDQSSENSENAGNDTSGSDESGDGGRFLGIGILPIFAVVAVFLLFGSVLAAVIA